MSRPSLDNALGVLSFTALADPSASLEAVTFR